MEPATFKIGETEYVVLPRWEYDDLTRTKRDAEDALPEDEYLSPAEQDALDAEIARKAMEDIDSGKIKPMRLEDAMREWGT